MQKLKKIIEFLNKNPVIYFIIFATYGWVFYKFYTVPTEMPASLLMPAMNYNPAVMQIEKGMYNRAKEFNADKCLEAEPKNESVFCKMGCHYYNYISVLEESFVNTKKNSILLEKALLINEFPKALALGGAIKKLNLEVSELPIDKKWRSYVQEGYGFFTIYTGFRDRYKYPLSTTCLNNAYSDFCNFGVGQAGYYLNYNQDDFKYSAMAAKGAEFAAVFGDKNRPTSPTPIEQYALALINYEKVKKDKLFRCTEKKHPAQCF